MKKRWMSLLLVLCLLLNCGITVGAVGPEADVDEAAVEAVEETEAEAAEEPAAEEETE